MTTQAIQSRQQAHLSQAYADVTAVTRQLPAKAQEIYGGLCHTLPVLIRTNGLCQTLAFIAAKGKIGNPNPGDSDRVRAYRALHGHLATTLGLDAAHAHDTTLLDRVRTAPVDEYMRLTLLALEAWIYYKRFAVALLDADPTTIEE